MKINENGMIGFKQMYMNNVKWGKVFVVVTESEQGDDLQYYMRIPTTTCENPYSSPISGHVNYYDCKRNAVHLKTGQLVGLKENFVGKIIEGEFTVPDLENKQIKLSDAKSGTQFTVLRNNEAIHYICTTDIWTNEKGDTTIHCINLKNGHIKSFDGDYLIYPDAKEE